MAVRIMMSRTLPGPKIYLHKVDDIGTASRRPLFCTAAFVAEIETLPTLVPGNAKAASEHTKVGKIINREYEDLGLKPDPEKLHPAVPEPVIKQTLVPRGGDNINVRILVHGVLSDPEPYLLKIKDIRAAAKQTWWSSFSLLLRFKHADPSLFYLQVVEEHHYDEQMREVEEKREKVRKTEAAKTVADKLKEVLNTHNNRYATVTKTIHEHESKTQKRLDSIKDERDSFLETYRQQRDQALKSAQESGRKRKDLAEENRDLKSKVKELDGPVREEHRQMKAKDREIAELKKALKDRT